tara:strand:- start:283 stop:1002 length:720 start_codon:yes stop_codon:yes gene_type:complete
MALNRVQLEDHVSFVIGEDHEPRIDPLAVIDEAGQHLFALHGWRWRNRPPALLDFVTDQKFVSLPSDFGFGDIVELTMDDNVTYGVKLSSLHEIEYLRSTTILSPSYYFAALAWPTQVDTTQGAAPAHLEIYPTPTADDVGAMHLTYKAGWVPLTDARSAANIPPIMDHLLVQLVRAFAYYYGTMDRSHIEEVENSTQLKTLKKTDAHTQSNLGAIRGGILQHDRTVRSNWNFTTAGPS